MEELSISSPRVSEGILIGDELAYWAGFTSGKIIVQLNDGQRREFKIGKGTQGTIPPIGSLISINHTLGNFPEVIGLETLDSSKHMAIDNIHEPLLVLGRTIGVAILVLTDILLGFALIVMGLLYLDDGLLAPTIYVASGIPFVLLGYFLWFFTGD